MSDVNSNDPTHSDNGSTMNDRYDLAIVGAGMSTLSALRQGALSSRTIVLEHQQTHGGFLLPALPADEFQESWKLIQSFRLPEATTVRVGATVVGLLPATSTDDLHTLIVRQRHGTQQIQARKVLIATGGLERTREHARIPGTRPTGVVSALLVHQFLDRGYLPGRQAVVYGDSRYAAATARRLVRAGLEVTCLVPPAEHGDHEGAEILEIKGFPRLECITVRQNRQTFDLPTDLLVYTTTMMANTHWLKGSGLSTSRDGTLAIDSSYRTTIAGIFAVGTVTAPSLDHAESITTGKEVGLLLAGGHL